MREVKRKWTLKRNYEDEKIADGLAVKYFKNPDFELWESVFTEKEYILNKKKKINMKIKQLLKKNYG